MVRSDIDSYLADSLPGVDIHDCSLEPVSNTRRIARWRLRRRLECDGV